MYPPVVLGLTGLGVLWITIRHRWMWLRYMALAYALGVLLTLSRNHELNWMLFGGGIIVGLLVLGAVLRNLNLCFAGVVALTVGLGTTDLLARFARAHDLTVAGATLGFGGLGTMAIALAFGRRMPPAFVLIGTLSTMACIFDYLPKALHWVDLAVLAVIGVLFAALLLRTRDVAPALVLWIPVFPRAYLLVTKMSSWSFVLLAFLLLFLGATMSLFIKRRLLSQARPCKDPAEEGPGVRPQS